MKLSSSDLRELTDLAIKAATDAGQMIARSRPTEVEHKAGVRSLASQVVTEIDRRSEDIILNIIRPTLERFELGLLTEEQDDDKSRLTADYFWCVDPLDGTLPFIEGTPGYAVSIALVERDGRPQIGVVYDPVQGTLWHAISGAGAFRDGSPQAVRVPDRDVLSVFVNRSFFEQSNHEDLVGRLDQIASDMGLRAVQLDATSGAVMNACGVLASAPACYFTLPKPAGGGNLWDFAATACLFGEAGAVATDIYGDALDLNRPGATNMAHRGIVFATNEDLGSRIRALHF